MLKKIGRFLILVCIASVLAKCGTTQVDRANLPYTLPGTTDFVDEAMRELGRICPVVSDVMTAQEQEDFERCLDSQFLRICDDFVTMSDVTRMRDVVLSNLRSIPGNLNPFAESEHLFVLWIVGALDLSGDLSVSSCSEIAAMYIVVRQRQRQEGHLPLHSALGVIDVIRSTNAL